MSDIGCQMASQPLSQRIQQTRDIGRLITAGRKRARLSQTELAAQLGVSRKTVSNLERGVTANILLSTALQALRLAGFVLEAQPRRPPTITEVMARRAADQARADKLSAAAATRSARSRR
jgi:transcriptional regulator with XRE-family HTH domain